MWRIGGFGEHRQVKCHQLNIAHGKNGLRMSAIFHPTSFSSSSSFKKCTVCTEPVNRPLRTTVTAYTSMHRHETVGFCARRYVCHAIILVLSSVY